MRHLDRRFRNYLLLKVAVWGLAYLAIGGYSHHQARAVREDTLGTQVKFLEIYLAVVNVTFPQVANIGRDLIGVLFTFTICSAIYFKVCPPLENQCSTPFLSHQCNLQIIILSA